MTRYFMRDTPLYQMEQMMMTPPHFKPRGHGLRRPTFHYRRMVSLCKRAVDTPDDTLMGYVTEAYPIVVYCRQLENKQRRITNISECEILPDGSRRLHKLYEYNITENRLEGDRFIIEGHHQKCEEMSGSLQRRFIENGMPHGELEQFIQRKEETA